MSGRMILRVLVVVSQLALPHIAMAVQPDEVLTDPALEARARDLSKMLRCPICQAENIDDSTAEVARDLRLLVRERIVAGDSDSAVLEYVTDRYGEFVLFRPTAQGGNLILWLAGPGMLLTGAAIAGAWMIRQRRRHTETAELSADEARHIDEIMRR